MATMAVTASGQSADPREITLLVPGGAGGGWDLTARAMKATLESEGLARVRIELSPGPGGSVGLAQLLSGHRGDENTLLVGGLVMLSAAASQRLAISPLDTTAIARLTGDYPVIVVPASSPYRTVGDLMTAVKDETAAFPWAGGSSGSLYERLVGDLYESAGISRSAVNYVPHNGGREVAESLLSDRTRVGVSEGAEIEPYLARRELRALAVAAPERIEGLDIPTLRESGYGVTAVNWRGVFAGPGITKAAQDRLEVLVARMVQSATWKEAIRHRRWTDLYQGSAAFRDFMETEQSRWSVPPRASSLREGLVRRAQTFSWLSSLTVALVALGVCAFGWFLWRSRAPRVQLAPALVIANAAEPVATENLPQAGEAEDSASEDASTIEVQAPGPVVAPEADAVALAFDTWKLTSAERDIAELMLQGLRYKQIAGKRGTSERTVRQQAQIILKKAGLDGRADLPAYFLRRDPHHRLA